MEPPKIDPEFHRFYHQLLSPLSLLPRRPTAPEPPKRSPQASILQTVPLAKLRVAPLCRQVAKLLANSGMASWVPSEGRLRLTNVILDELKCSWREPPAEPGLSYENNQKLRKRLEAYVLLSCEQLFLRYLHLLVTMSTMSRVFTESATLTRLAASLARDCTVFLTSPDVYRCLLADFQTLLKAEQTHSSMDKRPPACPIGSFKLCPIPWPHSTGFAQVPCSSLNLNYLVQLSRPPEFFIEPELDPLKELKSIPQLKSRKPLRRLPTIRKEKDMDFSSSQMVPIPSHSVTPASRGPLLPTLHVFSQLQRSQSMPCLREGWKLADELGLSPLPPRPLTPLVLAPGKSKPELTGETVAADLKQKIKNMNLEWTHYSALDSGLPPLLGVVTHHPAAAHHLEELQRMLKSFQEEEASRRWDLLHPKSPPLYPQPVTNILKLKNKIVVQAAAVRLSDRNFLDSFHVEGAKVLYNHLAGELDSKVIEEMDINRLTGISTKEVYEELMNRVSNDHFCFDQGPLVEPAADKDWSNFLSSAFLRHKKQFQIVNPDLTGIYQRINASQSNPERMPSPTPPQASKNWEKRSNKIWLNLWKSTLSVDDYFKYLTNQETDFLHVIFQMFEEEVPVEVPVRIKKSPMIQRPPPLLEDEEPDFVPGEWDWNTVLEQRLEGEKDQILSLQERLERLWSVLEVPHKGRLDMAIKYSSKARLRQLPALVRAWEKALKPIQLREVLLGKLEWFEQQASDPNRFFQRSELGMSHLLQENQLRSYFHRKLNQMEPSLVILLKEIELIFGEPVTFKGQRYLDKMKWDKVEMLYWLQQQRRVHYLSQDKKASQQSALFKRHNSQPLLVPGNTPDPL
ncbi:Coiled-coil domain-containing protein 87 [Sciurus carolinensis]|uniref:Coiled-coil domain-containing protein 87 n=1 Tax=Sciurus carolinensis TaxID=30640 RepID=A0AA41MZI4_SCICA|nr:Coiled-coil domain-containing protein 87 [Sciurus carolinensis]